MSTVDKELRNQRRTERLRGTHANARGMAVASPLQGSVQHGTAKRAEYLHDGADVVLGLRVSDQIDAAAAVNGRG